MALGSLDAPNTFCGLVAYTTTRKKSPKPSQAEITCSHSARVAERDTVPKEQLTDPRNRVRRLGVAPFGALILELGRRHRKVGCVATFR